MDYSIIDIPKSRLPEIKQLWEKLNQIHLLDSVYFKDHYKSFTFEMRIESFIKIDDENIKISIIVNGDKTYGYCVSAISEAKGELESRLEREGLKAHVIAVETVDKMTDRQVAAKVRERFPA